MAQDQAVLERPAPVPIRRSLSDRPVWVRWAVHFGRFFRSKPLGGIGVVIIGLCVFAAIFGNLIDRYNPEDIFTRVNPAFDQELYEKSLTDPTIRLTARPEQLQKGETPLLFSDPSSKHWLGTDGLGRDLYSRIIHGASTALYVGLGAALIATISCYRGYHATGGATGVGRATTRAVVETTSLILVGDYILTALLM